MVFGTPVGGTLRRSCLHDQQYPRPVLGQPPEEKEAALRTRDASIVHGCKLEKESFHAKFGTLFVRDLSQ